MMPDYWAVPNHQHVPHRLVSSFINNSINPYVRRKGSNCSDSVSHIRASITTFVLVFSHIVITFISYKKYI